ncbi:TNT domain-containing protein [Streptacidiphilus sp. MAP5-3]|jgi:hypothetical protein|uniref:TNT domain-containing protein n=1 Tax=unclassified Streptacidiphilus TaxID=2643834 RepID=UPI0035190D35
MTVAQNLSRIGAGLALVVAATALTGVGTGAQAAHADVLPSDACSAAFDNGDARLGPEQLPTAGSVGRELTGYHRTGGESPVAFLAQYYDPTAYNGAGGWRYPPDNGYLIAPDGRPMEIHERLLPGLDIDRFGSEYGSFLAPEGSAYSSRALPPQSLDGQPAAGCNYHDYKVLKPFEVDAGPIAPWFNQPGLGWQYQLDASLFPGAPAQLNVQWLVNNGYLERLV